MTSRAVDKQSAPSEVEVVADSLEAGIQAGAVAMGVAVEQVTAEVIEQKKAAFLGLSKAKVRVRVRAKPPEAAVNGRFLVGFKNGVVQVLVAPPQGAGARVSEEDMQAALKDLPLPAGTEQLWKAAVASASGRPVPLGRPTEAMTAAMADVIVSPDGMKAWLASTSLLFDDPVPEADVRQAIALAGVSYGVIDALVERVLGRALPVPRQFAQGIEAVSGQSGQIVFHFRAAKKEKTAQSDDKKSIDWFEQFSTETVEAGRVLVEATAPVQATKGMTVYGTEVPVPEGLPAEIEKLAGKNTELRDGRIVALIGGEPAIAEGKVVIFELLDIRKDVDFSTGNVRFPGSVNIKGDVTPGFRVEAKGNVQIGGAVAAGHVATGGDALIARGFLGEAEGRKGVLKVGGNLKVSFIEGGSVSVGGDLLAGQDIVRGDVGVLGSIKVEGRGRILGGKVSAGVEIYARTIGSEAGGRCVVSVGSPTAEAATVRDLLDAKALSLMEADVGKGDAAGASPPEAAQQDDKAAGGAETAPAEEEKPKGPRLVATDAIYPGTVVGIGRSARVVDRKIDHCVLREVNGEIQIFPL